MGKEEKYSTIFKKRIFKIGVVIVVFSLVYYINNILMNNKTFEIHKFLYTIFYKPITNAYWYLYMYIGLLIMLPILRKMIKNFENKDYIYCFSIWGVFIGTLPIFTHYLGIKEITKYLSLPIFTGYIVYFILGYFIENKLDRKYFNKKNAVILSIISLLCIAISVGLTYYEYVNLGNKKFMDNISFITISIPSITVFYISKYICMKFEKKIKGKLISKISLCTFGIYLISDLLIQKFDFIYSNSVKYIHPLISVIILEITVFMVGFIFSWILKKIPVIKNIMN